jgi:hypothetical protein
MIGSKKRHQTPQWLKWMLSGLAELVLFLCLSGTPYLAQETPTQPESVPTANPQLGVRVSASIFSEEIE